MDNGKHAVTGAFGYSGKYIAQQLLDRGHDVITLTNSPQRPNPFGDRVRAFAFNFDHPDELTRSLTGVAVLYNTYWVRFNHPLFRHADAVSNTLTLFRAARDAGVERIVHVSITNPSADSPLEYFRGKARLEAALVESGVSYAILRPAVIFGKEDILLNNIAWTLRRVPVFGVFGDGQYRLQPIYVEDLAALAVAEGAPRENVIRNAIGPETFTYRQLVATIGEIIGCPRRIISVSPAVGYAIGWLVGKFVGDVLLTRDEIRGLMADLLCVDAPPAETAPPAEPAPTPALTKLTDWARAHADTLGRSYTSELARRVDRAAGYRSN
jgi:NADH dehydrogenase